MFCKSCDLVINFPTIYDTTIFDEKPISDLFWALLGSFGPKNDKFHFFYKSCYRLAISFPTIYDTTIYGENQFLTILGAFLGHFGPENEKFQKNLRKF